MVRAIYNTHNINKMSTLQVFETDSTVHAAVARKIYTKSEALSRQTAKIVITLENHGIRQRVERVSQEKIKRSDQLSRIRDEDNLTMAAEEYQRLKKKWKLKPTKDHFTSRFSAKEKHYYSQSENEVTCQQRPTTP